MLVPVPLHEPASVIDALTTLSLDRDLPESGLAILYDAGSDPEPRCVVIPDVPADPPQHLRIQAMRPLLRGLAADRGARSAVLVVVRDGAATPRGGDYAWHDAFHAASPADLRPAGVYVLGGGVLAPVRAGLPALA